MNLSKMCFLTDAKNWTGLSNVKSITIPARTSTTVKISENWFATSIAVSYVKGGVRRITYADELNTNGSMHIMYNKILIYFIEFKSILNNVPVPI